MAKKLPRPSVRERRPASLYVTAQGETVREFWIPGYAACPSGGGLITVRRCLDGRAEIEITRNDIDLEVILPGPRRAVSVPAERLQGGAR